MNTITKKELQKIIADSIHAYPSTVGDLLGTQYAFPYREGPHLAAIYVGGNTAEFVYGNPSRVERREIV